MKLNRHRMLLVGMMGSGKTTIGKKLARALDQPFCDVDHLIEHASGVAITTIFEIEGEAGFRQRETRFLRQICEEATCGVIATGGGVVLNPINRAILSSCGCVVYLHATAEMIFSRTRYDRSRPLLQVKDPLSRIQALVRQRDPLYRECADLVVESGRGMQQTTSEILSALPIACKH